jgi:hypothetical protein
MPRPEVMHNMIDGSNLAICYMRNSREQVVSNFFVANHIVDKTILSSADNANVAPLYIYPETNTQGSLFTLTDTNTYSETRRPNLAPQYLEQFTKRLDMKFISEGRGDLEKTFGSEDIFSYMYAICYSQSYRIRYSEFLKKDFPRLPLTSQVNLFRALCGLGSHLVALHLMEQRASGIPAFNISGSDSVETVRYTEPGQGAAQGWVWINKEQYFEGVAPEVWNFHVGGYQVCQKWLKDRKGRTLEYEDIRHYQQIVAVLAETIRIMEQIDSTILEYGGWPIS